MSLEILSARFSLRELQNKRDLQITFNKQTLQISEYLD